MQLKPIKTDADYQEALKCIDTLMGSKPGTDEGDMLDILTTLVEAYEQQNDYELDLPDPIEAIKFRMEQEGLSRKSLEKIIGTRGRISEILGRKRALSLTMIRRIHESLSIPARVLIKKTEVR